MDPAAPDHGRAAADLRAPTRLRRSLSRTAWLACCGVVVAAAQSAAQESPPAFHLAGLEVRVEGEAAPFTVEVRVEVVQEGVEVAHVRLHSPRPASPPPLDLTWSAPALDVAGQWTTASRFTKDLGPDWGMRGVTSMLARNAPVVTLFGHDDRNRLTFAVDEALHTVRLEAGIREENGRMRGRARLFAEPSQPVRSVEVALRFDTRPVPLGEALDGVREWWEEEVRASAPVPDAARLPMYSTWYSYHQAVETDALLGEVQAAKELGYEAIIVDDGWQTLDTRRGYAYTGDWRPERIGDMRAFVDGVHERGMRVLLWYSVPLVGERSRTFERFRGRYLRYWEGQGAYVLDPRYPDVREHIIDTYRRAMSEWGVDGFKLDFLGFFAATDSTVLEPGGGRDYGSVNEATDRLMSDIMTELRRERSDVLIEFRQPYIGPLMRSYGNMFRAGDSPDDAADNRVRTVDLRLLSGGTAVHADMLMWHPAEDVASAARQILNVLFAVPQLSVRLAEIPPDHLDMVRFYTRYWRDNRDVLLDGAFEAHAPLANYPLVVARSPRKTIAAVYADVVVPLDEGREGPVIDVVNAGPRHRVVLDVHGSLGRVRVETRGPTGAPAGPARTLELTPGTHAFPVPEAGVLTLTRVGVR